MPILKLNRRSNNERRQGERRKADEIRTAAVARLIQARDALQTLKFFQEESEDINDLVCRLQEKTLPMEVREKDRRKTT